MGFWKRFPYTNFHELNADWLVKTVKALQEKVRNVVTSVNGSTGDVVIPIPSPATINPEPLGQYPAIGTDPGYARGDHVHPMPPAIIETTDVNLVGKADNVGSGAMSNTRRWFLPYIIPSGSEITEIQFHTASSTSGTITFEIWEKNGDALTLVKSVTITPVASAVNTALIGFTSTTQIMIGWKIENGTNIRQIGSTAFNLIATTDMSSTSLSFSSLNRQDFTTYTPCVTVSYTYTGPKEYFIFPETVVTVGEGMDFEEIQDAINNIMDDTPVNPYTILVMPKGTPYKPFSTLRSSFSEPYPWSGKRARNLSIVGLDKEHCVIQSDSGDYDKPCSEPMLNGIIKNLTFKMTNDDQDASATQGGYCMHIDSRTQNDIGYTMLIENCDFEDASGPCLGIGMHKNCTLIVRDCHMKTTLDQNYAPHAGYTNLYDYGVVFCHTSTRADATAQNVTFENCVGVCAEGTKSMWIAPAGNYTPGTSEFEYTILRNVFWNISQNASAYSIGNTLTPNPMNFGNNNT